MRLTLSNVTSKVIIAASKAEPKDITVQNISANTVYISFGPLSGINDGLKIVAGQSYSNDVLIGTLYAIADVDGSEIAVEIQDSWLRLQGPQPTQQPPTNLDKNPFTPW